MRNKSVSWSKPLKFFSSNCSLKFESMKWESLVIANQHVAVNLLLSFVYTARHISEVGLRKGVQ
jgi:hypothetical protein